MAPRESIKPKLVIIEGKDKGKVIPLPNGSTVIGRTKGDVLLQDPRISRSHVALIFDTKTGELAFTDLKSLNGTLHNGHPSAGATLQDGDRLQIGNTLFDCQLGDATELVEKHTPPLQPVHENPDLSGSFAQRKEPVFDPTPAPAAAETSNLEATQAPMKREPTFETAPPKKKALKQVSLFEKLRHLSPMRKRIAMGFAALAFCWMFVGGESGRPPADFDRSLNSLKQLEREGKVAEAITEGEKLSQSYGKDPELFITLAGLYTQQRRLEPAIAAYRKALTIDPDHPIATVRLIALYLRSGLTQEAQKQMEELDRLMREEKHSREFFIEAAELFLEFRDLTRSPEKAIILARALQRKYATDSTIGYRLEAQVLFQQQQTGEALEVIERGLQRDAQDEWLLENQAFAKLSLKDTTGAIEVVENWINLHPASTKPLLVLAYLKYNEKNYLAALPYLQKVGELSKNHADPHYPEALHLMGQIYWVQGQQMEAKNLLTRSCELGFQPACAHESQRTPQSVPKPTVKKQTPASSPVE
ncbi:FHA domain-containing protein [bacterium]|nr:FHA domain-containing protein [bacterium]